MQENIPIIEQNKTMLFDIENILFFKEKIQSGITLGDIENIIIIILILRFLLLYIQYNAKTACIITLIGLGAGSLWYRHLIDLLYLYSSTLLDIPFLAKLGLNGEDLIEFYTDIGEDKSSLMKYHTHWYNPGQILYYAIQDGIHYTHPETNIEYRIDLISMLISSLPEHTRLNVLPAYYAVYDEILPKILSTLGNYWQNFSSIAIYITIVRVGKRYCPYLIRWHWTFLIILRLLEQPFERLFDRISYYLSNILISQTNSTDSLGLLSVLKINFLEGLTLILVFAHIGFILFALLHAVLGQYFYLPFLVENIELHVGPRPENSIYSMGKTSWQNPEEKEKWKLWYGWFGRGTKTENLPSIGRYFVLFIRKQFRRLFKLLKR